MLKSALRVLPIVFLLQFQLAYADDCSSQKSYFKNVETLRAWVQKCPKSGEALFQLAMNLVQKGDVDQALTVLTPALDNEQMDARFPNVLLYAQLILNKGDVDGALRIATVLNEQVPDVREVVYLLAKTHLLKSDFKKSKLYSSQAVAKWKDPQAYSVLILSTYALREYAAVLEAYQQALKENVPADVLFADPSTGLSVAHASFLQGNSEQAASVMRDQLSRHPELAKNGWVVKFVADLKQTGH